MDIASLLNPLPPIKPSDQHTEPLAPRSAPVPLKRVGEIFPPADRSAQKRIRAMSKSGAAISQSASGIVAGSGRGEPPAGSDGLHARPQSSPVLRSNARPTVPAPRHEQAAVDIEAMREVGLAAYLLARERIGQPIEDMDPALLSRLRRANQTVEDVKGRLHLGRGNVRQDIKARYILPMVLSAIPDQIWEKFTDRLGAVVDDVIVAGQDRGIDDHKPQAMRKLVIFSAMADTLHAGLCRHFSSLTIALHAKKLANLETLDLQVSEKLDHMWIHADGVLMDAWSNGPAVLEEDSMLGSVPTREPSSAPKVLRHPGQDWYAQPPFLVLDNTDAGLISEAFSKVKNVMINDAEIMQEIGDLITRDMACLGGLPQWERGFHFSLLWNEQSVFSQNFHEHAIQTLNDPSSKQKDLAKKVTGLSDTQVREKISLGTEVLATKVARRLGANFSDASRVAPLIVERARTFIPPPTE